MTAARRPAEPLEVFTCPLTGVNLIEASAGTGKTWTICGLYLRLLLERELTVQQILVVTFTNAATAELRERVRARILELLDFLRRPLPGIADPFIGQLAGQLRDAGKTQQELTARLELALHSFDEAAIFTIHGFCQRALADNPFAAGLPMRTELTESDRDLVMETVYDFWRRHVAHDATPEFARYLASKRDTPDKYARLLQRHLAKPLARHRWPPDLDAPPLSASQLHEAYRTVRAHWLACKTEIEALLHAALSQLNGSTYKRASLLEAAAHWDRLCCDEDAFAAMGTKAGLFRSSMLAEKTKKNCITPTHEFFRHAEAYCRAREALDGSLYLARCRLLKRLFGEASLRLQSLKRSRQVVAFNDMLANVHERLENADYPWLAASIRTRFPAALIDEFQDTDPLQLAIFNKIYDTDDSLVFLVGDPKQAIYSFRHADLHSYLRAAHWADRQWTLRANQRSSGPLLTGLNTLFGANGNAFVLPQVHYRAGVYGDKPRADFRDTSAARAPLQVWRLPDDDGVLPKARAKRAAVEAVAAEIARLLEAARGGGITLGERALQPGDVAVLVRARSLGADVKRALAELHVGAVELSRDSIFGSADARDWETVLTAIAAPTRDGLLRAALATEIFGEDAAGIERIAASDTLLPARILEFMAYRDLWVKRGLGMMIRQVFAEQGVARRLLGGPDGERRLTNCLHVAEELQKAAQSHPSPEALLRWFKAAQAEDDPLDSAQLRLESDRDLVQIVTVHACKGLEYPIVFCPFLCDGSSRFGPPGPEGWEYHDAELEPVIDFNDYRDDAAALQTIKTQIKEEQAAETVRLLYVALTRAVHRCYLVIGPYDTHAKYECARSMLNWLAAGNGMTPTVWLDSKLSTAELDAAWAGVAAASGGAIVIDPLPMQRGVSLRGGTGDAATLDTPAPPGQVSAGWRFSSYSNLSYGARGEAAAGDHDARTIVLPAANPPPADLHADDILRFPRGADAGECIHAVFEHIDFTDRKGWDDAIARALQSHPPSRGDDPAAPPAPTLQRMLRQLVEHVVTATLMPGLQLGSIPLSRRLTELEFNLPVPHLSAAALNAGLKSWGYAVPALTFGALEGYLKGFIDLVFEHQGRYFILDWKSNHLGYTATDYGPVSLQRAMTDHGYHLQYLLYAIALDRYLKLRLPGYRHETHFGGVLYLFVRGVRPIWPASDPGSGRVAFGGSLPGVFFHRPEAATLRALDRLLASERSPAVNTIAVSE